MSLFDKINLYVMLTMHEDYVEDEEVLAYTCQLHVNQNVHDIHAAFDKFESYVHKKHPDMSISAIYNRYVYNWFHGNIMTFLYHLVFTPHAYLPLKFKVNRRFVQECITLLHKFTSDPKYALQDENIYEFFEDLKSIYKCFPIDYDQFVVLKTIAKHGNLTRIQRDLIKIKVERMRKKKRDAVRVIEDWWFEIINSPRTLPGKRMLQKRAIIFKSY